MRQIYPVEGPELDVVPAARPGPVPDSVRELARLYQAGQAGSRPGLWLRANMVASVDGAASLGGRSGGLSGPADRMIFTVLRSLADLILVGAGTARAERYRPAQAPGLWAGLRPAGAPPPAIAVLTASLDLDPDGPLLGARADPPPLVITTAMAPADRKTAIGRRARLIETGGHQVSITAAVAELAALGYRQILCEGGPTLLGQLADAGLVDELCLTTSPVLAAGPASRIVSAPQATGKPAGSGAARPAGTAMPVTATAAVTAPLSLSCLLADGSFLFSRYLRGR